MGKLYYAFDINSTALLGVLDELYDIYLTLKEIYERSLEEFFSNPETADRFPDYDYFDKLNHCMTKKALNGFFQSHSDIFSLEYQPLRVNDIVLKRFSMCYFQHGEGRNFLSAEIKLITFAEFLKDIQLMAYRLIERRKGFDQGYPVNDPEVVWDEVNARINDMVRERENKAFIRQPSRTVQADSHTVIVFRSLAAISCNRYVHEIENDSRLVPLLNGEGLVRLPIHHCKTCGRLFVGEKTLEVYEHLYGKMRLRLERDKDSTEQFWGLTESPLHRAGYNVQVNGMSEDERKQLLKGFLDNSVFTPFEIIRDIEKAINLFEYRPEYVDAVNKWKSDLRFVAEYKSIDRKDEQNETQQGIL